MTSYQKVLENILRMAGFNEKYKINDLLTEDVLKEFEICFTHESVNPKQGQNYDIKEFVGDSIYGTMIKILFYEIYGNRFKQGIYTNIAKNFSWRGNMKKISYKLNLVNLIKFTDEVDLYVKEKAKTDVLEAVTYFLYDIVNRKIQDGLGFVAVRNFLFNLFSEMDLFHLTTEQIKEMKDSITVLNELRNAIKKGYVPNVISFELKKQYIPYTDEKNPTKTKFKYKVIAEVLLSGAQTPENYGESSAEFSLKKAKNDAAKLGLERLQKEGKYSYS